MLRRELLRLFLYQIRVEVNLVNLPFSVRDAQGRLVKGLTKDDFEVYEDGARQTISHFSQAADTPLALGLVADASGSQEEFLKEHRQHLRDFLKVTLQARDQAFLLCFGNNLRLVSPFTNQSEQIEERLRAYQKSKTGRDFPRVGPPENRDLGTAFYDAIFHATEDLLAKAETGRRALLVFSDGEDNSSAHHLLETIEAAQRTGTTIFCLRYTELQKGGWNARNKYGRGVMERIARETGGLEFDAAEERNLKAAFAQIGEILRSSYDLAYASTAGSGDDTFRKIQIRTRQPGLAVRHKTGYFARKD
jgi:Ca-activated chloride channel family protein